MKVKITIHTSNFEEAKELKSELKNLFGIKVVDIDPGFGNYQRVKILAKPKKAKKIVDRYFDTNYRERHTISFWTKPKNEEEA